MSRLSFYFPLVFTVLSTAARAGGISPTWAEASAPAPSDVFKVTQYLDLGDETNLVLIGGSGGALIVGATLKTYRATAPGQTADGQPIWVETGRMKVIDVQPDATVARVDGQGGLLAKAFFPKFPGVMAGDVAVLQRLALVRRQQVLPAIQLSYVDLFDDPKATPISFELRADGVAALREAAKTFVDARVSLLMVEGYTDHNGPASANQIESYQRALTVRQYLIDELGFDPKRVVAVGYGESEPADSSFAPGYVEANRRIVLKAVQLPGR
jgi:hypothetical protein